MKHKKRSKPVVRNAACAERFGCIVMVICVVFVIQQLLRVAVYTCCVRMDVPSGEETIFGRERKSMCCFLFFCVLDDCKVPRGGIDCVTAVVAFFIFDLLIHGRVNTTS
jgi:hypothetical protein